jgi:hypothetical protein
LDYSALLLHINAPIVLVIVTTLSNYNYTALFDSN